MNVPDSLGGVLKDLRLPTDLFESARLKLTGFYFGVLVVFCLVLTFGVRVITIVNFIILRNLQKKQTHSPLGKKS